MKTILLTGGTGALGKLLTPRLGQAGYAVRLMSRRSQPSPLAPGLSWAQADLVTGQGVAAAVAGVDIIIHAASNPVKTQATDLSGTERLLAAAQGTALENFVYISIIGIDKIPFSYYQAKLAIEEKLQASHVPWSIVRATQFHTLTDLFLGALARLPILPVPADFQMQTVDPGEVADAIVTQLQTEATGRWPSITGPAPMKVRAMVPPWLAARKLRRWVLPVRLPGKVAAGFRAGYTTGPAEIQGKVTWQEWLEHTYPAA